MPTAKLYALSYYQARNLGLPVLRPPRFVTSRVRPTRRPLPLSGASPILHDYTDTPRWSAQRIGGVGAIGGVSPMLAGPSPMLAAMGQPGATITLPDGRDHTVRSENTTGEILTTDGWQSATQPDGTERWIDTRTGDVMLANGEIIRAGAGGFLTSTPFLAGAGALALVGVYLMLPRRGRGGRRRRRR